MKQACIQFLTARLQALTLADGYTKPYTTAEPSPTLFFRDLPRDFLKDNDYAVCCLPLIDRNRKNGRLISLSRDIPTKTLTLIRRRFNREIIFRCLLFGAPNELYGTDTSIGLVDQLTQGIAEYHHIAASDNSAILIEPQDTAQPWDSAVEMERKLDRPALAIVRVQFTGGIQVDKSVPLIPSVEFNPLYQ